MPTKEGNVELGVPLVLSEILLLYPAELNLGLGLVKGVKESWFSTMFSLFPDSLHSVGFAFVVAGVFALWSRTEISASLVPSSLISVQVEVYRSQRRTQVYLGFEKTCT